MPLTTALSFLVHPGRGLVPQPQIGGTEVLRGTTMWTNVQQLYDRADEECTIQIQFRRADDGAQRNPRRDILAQFCQNPTIERGREIASLLQHATTERSHLGLLFLLLGRNPAALVLARFPASEGIVAEEHGAALQVDFVEQIFLKNLHSYKSVYYRGPFVERAFWQGKAVDKQLKTMGTSPNYWIQEFLMSELMLTPAAGTKRLALAIRKAIHDTDDQEVKSSLLTFAQIVRHQAGNVITPVDLATQAGLGNEALEALSDGFARAELGNDAFQFDRDEFDRHVGFRMVELDNGARLIAADDAFEEVFTREALNQEVQRFSTQGRVVRRELRKTP